jgi:hypothetical protein
MEIGSVIGDSPLRVALAGPAKASRRSTSLGVGRNVRLDRRLHKPASAPPDEQANRDFAGTFGSRPFLSYDELILNVPAAEILPYDGNRTRSPARLSGRIEQFSQDLRLLIQRELPTTLRQNAKRQPSQDKRFRAAITTFADVLLVQGCESRGQSDHQEVHMPRMYPATVRRQVVSRLRSGEPVAVVAADTGICQAKLFRWKRQALTERA